MRVRLVDSALTSYLWRYLNSPFAKTYWKKMATGTAGNMPKINSPAVRQLPIAVPPLIEIYMLEEIVDGVSSAEEAMASTISAEARRAASLRQSILGAAFRGELVPHDPADEPASVLLGRIRADRAGEPARRRGRRPANALA